MILYMRPINEMKQRKKHYPVAIKILIPLLVIYSNDENFVVLFAHWNGWICMKGGYNTIGCFVNYDA